MLAGRNFSRNNSSFDEKHSIIIDEASMKQLDFRSFDEAIDTEVFIGNQRVKIIGVINNFAQQSLNNVHSPTILKFITPGDIRFLSIRINPNNSNDLITLISTLWKESFSNYSLEHFFLKDYFNVQYDEENRLLKILGIFSIISLLISSLGVFGLTYFEMIKRAKEISIRKLLGSTVSNIILLMSRSYFILLGISFIISIPIVYYIMSIWLNNFSLKIDMTLLFFLIPLTLVMQTFIKSIHIAKEHYIEKRPESNSPDQADISKNVGVGRDYLLSQTKILPLNPQSDNFYNPL